LLDVRNREEYDLGHITGAKHIPVQELEERVGELDPDLEIVVYCKGGVRSLRAAELLSAMGFRSIVNLTGGILAWAQDVDPSIACY
jgi:sulfur-carrier protein adenylyltransferase/sulfurtransferase